MLGSSTSLNVCPLPLSTFAAMKMGNMQLTATLQPPMLILDDCVAADSMEIEIGDLLTLALAPSPGCNVREVTWGNTSFVSATETINSSNADSSGESVSATRSDDTSDSDLGFGITSSSQRLQRKQRRQERLQRFLHQHGFAGVNDRSNCPEKLYPIHAVSKCGDHGMIRLLLAAHADPTVKTAKGHTALDFARGLPQCETRLHVIELLRNQREDHGHAGVP